MSGAYGIAERHLQAALDEADTAGIDGERLAKAMLGVVLQRYREHRSLEDIRSLVAFELEHLGGDVDIPFMRP